VQVDPVQPTLKAPGTKRLKLKYDDLVSNFTFKFNLRRYNKGMNVNPLNEAVLSSAESILRSGHRLVCGFGGDPDEQESAW